MSNIAERFSVRGRFVNAVLLKGGHIHDTYLATYMERGRSIRYIHQRINRYAFPDPDRLMDNVSRVTTHLRAKLERAEIMDAERRALTLIPGRDGCPYYVDEAGAYWRTYVYIESTQTHDVVKTPDVARRAAAAFGRFQKLLMDLPEPRLYETIPDFHNTPKRYQRLCRAVEANTCGRADSACAEIDFAVAREPMAHVLRDLQASGKLPERVVHNDTKINNVLFDAKTNDALCVIDLDTVMPGLALHDFGDLARTMTSPCSEDDRDVTRVYVNLSTFEALTEGYLHWTQSFLTQRELTLLPFAAILITYETGMRFLTDYLEGDVYFKTERSDHNLDRCRNQFELVHSMEAQQDRMAAAVDRVRQLRR